MYLQKQITTLDSCPVLPVQDTATKFTVLWVRNKAKIKSCSISQIKHLTTLLNSCPVLQVKITKFKIILVQFYKFRIQLKVIIFWRSSYSSCSPYQRYLVRTQLVVFPSPDVKSCIFEWSPPCLVMKGRDIEFESQHFIWVDFHPHFLKKM